LLDYIELVDWIGRIIREDKRGAVVGNHLRRLDTLGLKSGDWLNIAIGFDKNQLRRHISL